MDRRRSRPAVADGWRRLRSTPIGSRWFVPSVLLVAALAVGAGVAAAHADHASATTQQSADGTVVVQQAFLSSPGYLVLRADDGGEPGRVLGYRSVGTGLHTGTRVTLDSSYWRQVTGTTTVWVVVHGSNGDGRFDPAADPLRYFYSSPAGERVTIEKADRAAALVTNGTGSLRSGALPVRDAILPEAGHVVVHARRNGSLGRVLGARSLPSGRHRGVVVPVETSLVPDPHDSVTVALYRDDGDGEFDVETDSLVRVAGEPIVSRFDVRDADTGGVRINTPESPIGGGPTGRTTRTDRSTNVGGTGLVLPIVVGVVVVALLAAGTVAVRRRGG